MSIMIKKAIAAKIRQARRVAITSHVRPDADSIGSGLALMGMLRQLGKKVRFFNHDRAPYPINRLPGYDQIEHRQIAPDSFDTIILIEGGNEERTGQKCLGDYFCINIDHHQANLKDCDLNWVVPEAAAVGELIYELGRELKVRLDHDITFNLYAAILADTGSFKYSNTTHRSLQIAAELSRAGRFAPNEVSNLLFNSNPLEKIRMMTQVLATLELHLKNRVATMVFKREFLKKLKLRDIETEDIVAVARSIDRVQALLFFKEIADDHFRVSIRSRDDFSAQEVARHFQGGGHHHAAGFFFKGSFTRAKKEILAVVRRQLP